MTDFIEIHDPIIIDERRVSFPLSFSKKLKKYFLSNVLFFEYEKKIHNEQNGILYIPAVASIFTIAWALGADIFVKRLDKTYLKSLYTVGRILKDWYPDFSSSRLFVDDVVSNKFSSTGYGLLFTGGIDSTSSYIRHRDKKPHLITLMGEGADIQAENKKLVEDITNFSRMEKVKVSFIKTNMESVINRQLLYEEFGLHWWLNVGYGLMLTSVCAPITQIEDIKTLLIASSGCTESFRYPFGSHPMLDNNISWADVNVIHDSYEIARQDKIKIFLKKYIEETGRQPKIRVCTRQSSENCGQCEKCFRTILGLLVGGIDPKKSGFKNFDAKTLDLIRDGFAKNRLVKRDNPIERRGQLYIRMAEIFLWQDIQEHISEEMIDNSTIGNFFKWFKNIDIENYSQKTNLSLIPHFLFSSLAQTLAPFNSYLPESLRVVNRQLAKTLSKRK